MKKLFTSKLISSRVVHPGTGDQAGAERVEDQQSSDVEPHRVEAGRCQQCVHVNFELRSFVRGAGFLLRLRRETPPCLQLTSAYPAETLGGNKNVFVSRSEVGDLKVLL